MAWPAACAVRTYSLGLNKNNQAVYSTVLLYVRRWHDEVAVDSAAAAEADVIFMSFTQSTATPNTDRCTTRPGTWASTGEVGS